MEKNFDKVHVNGVYETRASKKYVIVPFDRRKDYMHNCKNAAYRIGLENTSKGVKYPSWFSVDDDGRSEQWVYEYDFVKYLGEYNWETGNIEMEKPESFLVRKNIIESNSVYEHEKFAAIVTIRNGKKLVNFDFKNCIDKANDLEVEDFKQLLKLLNSIPLEDL